LQKLFKDKERKNGKQFHSNFTNEVQPKYIDLVNNVDKDICAF